LVGSAPGEQDEDGENDDGDEDEAGDGDADGEVSLREADGRRVVNLRRLK
jgi:hypothetical protein